MIFGKYLRTKTPKQLSRHAETARKPVIMTGTYTKSGTWWNVSLTSSSSFGASFLVLTKWISGTWASSACLEPSFGYAEMSAPPSIIRGGWIELLGGMWIFHRRR
jgi:hypothetical protein